MGPYNKIWHRNIFLSWPQIMEPCELNINEYKTIESGFKANIKTWVPENSLRKKCLNTDQKKLRI